MTPGNLGIVFGPTLLRPRPTEATVSLSSLVDYPHQARVVETLITHYCLVFEEEPEEVAGAQVRQPWALGLSPPQAEGLIIEAGSAGQGAGGTDAGTGRCLVPPGCSGQPLRDLLSKNEM